MATPNLTGYHAYQKSKYETASPHKLILLLYDAAISNIQRAMELLDNGDVNNARPHILKAQDIVYELLACLNEEQGGEIAQNLKRVYFYSIQELVQANIRRDRTRLADVLGNIRTLRAAWSEIGKEVGLGANG